MRKTVVFVDVDDTLVRTVGSTRIPMPATIAQIRRLSNSGSYTLYCWSSGGADYARASAQELGLEDCFETFLPKPEVYVDDQEFADWRYVQHILPSNASQL